MALQTLPSSWGAPTTCFQSTDLYAVAFSTGSGVTQWAWWFGVPSTLPEHEDCLPPSYETSALYYARACPSGYQYVSGTRTIISSQVASMSFCCPGAGFIVNEGFCLSAVTTDGPFIVTYTDDMTGGGHITTFTNGNGAELKAYGIIIVSGDSISPSTAISSIDGTTPSPTSSLPTETGQPQQPPEQASGLSTGAAIGIGVGTASAIIILSLLGWFVYRRRAKKRADTPPAVGNDPPRTRESDLAYSAPKTPSVPGALGQENVAMGFYPLYHAQQHDTQTLHPGEHRPMNEMAS